MVKQVEEIELKKRCQTDRQTEMARCCKQTFEDHEAHPAASVNGDQIGFKTLNLSFSLPFKYPTTLVSNIVHKFSYLRDVDLSYIGMTYRH